MSLDKPQPVEALSTSYEFGLSRPPIERVSLAERFDACAAKRSHPALTGRPDSHLCGETTLPDRFHTAAAAELCRPPPCDGRIDSPCPARRCGQLPQGRLRDGE
jgi:hypothetical protein